MFNCSGSLVEPLVGRACFRLSKKRNKVWPSKSSSGNPQKQTVHKSMLEKVSIVSMCPVSIELREARKTINHMPFYPGTTSSRRSPRTHIAPPLLSPTTGSPPPRCCERQAGHAPGSAAGGASPLVAPAPSAPSSPVPMGDTMSVKQFLRLKDVDGFRSAWVCLQR